MAVKVAINGFGRIGRLAFRQMFGAEGYEVVAINDLTSPKMLAHLLKYDSSQGKYALADKVTAGEDSITVDGKEIKIYAKANAEELPWGEIGVDVVLECTGFYTSKAKAEAHIKAGARKVVISAPAGNDLPTIVYNVNHDTLKPEDTETLFKGIKEIKIREINVVEKDEHLMEKEEKEDEITYYVDFDLIYNENNEGITYNDGGDTRNFYLKKVKGEWKIISIGLL